MTIIGRTELGPPVGTPTRPVRRWFEVVTGVGLLILVVGTFLPWLRSGTAERTSYAADGEVRHLLDLRGLSGAVLMVWPFVSLLCALALGLLILRLTRTGLALSALCALAVGLVCVRILHTGSTMVIGVAAIGPGVTLAGCVVVLGAALVLPFRAAITGAALSHRSRRI